MSKIICVRVSYFVFNALCLCYCLVFSTSTIDCLERLVSEMTYYVEWDVKPYTVTHANNSK